MRPTRLRWDLSRVLPLARPAQPWAHTYSAAPRGRTRAPPNRTRTATIRVAPEHCGGVESARFACFLFAGSGGPCYSLTSACTDFFLSFDRTPTTRLSCSVLKPRTHVSENRTATQPHSMETSCVPTDMLVPRESHHAARPWSLCAPLHLPQERGGRSMPPIFSSSQGAATRPVGDAGSSAASTAHMRASQPKSVVLHAVVIAFAGEQPPGQLRLHAGSEAPSASLPMERYIVAMPR